MNQIALSFALAAAPTAAPRPTRGGMQTDQLVDRPADHPAEADRTGFDIGWDHAQHGLAPPAGLLLDDAPVGQGWRAGRAVFGRRTMNSQHSTRQWLALRLHAWRRGIAYATQQLNANALARIHTERCPVRRSLLIGAGGQPDAAVVDRLNAQVGYAAGNVATISLAASTAWAGTTVLDAVRQAHRIAAAGLTGPAARAGAQPGPAGASDLDAAAWWRLAALRAYATPLPFHEAARLPLAVLPPRDVPLLNPVQALQALLTLQFAQTGWSARTRAIGALLPAHTLRHDYNLFIGALAPRALEAGSTPLALRQGLEDAWLHERVQRRWQHFALSLGESGVALLLERAAALGQAVFCALQHGNGQARGPAREPVPALDRSGRALQAL